MRRTILALLLALALPATAAAAQQKQVKPDRAAINRLLDQFVPSIVAGKAPAKGRKLVAGYLTTSVQHYPAKGTAFHGWTVNYSYPGDVGFDILLQPTKDTIGAWSFRAEAQKIDGVWKMTTWYPVATFAPAHQTQTVLGPNDLGPANGAAAAGVDRGRLAPWVLLLPALGIAALALGVLGFAGARWLRRRGRVRELQRSLAR
jgi:hypothetical protein